jgi:D-tyrosyl-tRNA(Tyr) deacylase
MRMVIQRVSKASVKIDNEIVGQIDAGMMVLLGVEEADGKEDADWLLQKILGLRIFNDAEGKMNKSIGEINGRFLVVSQFTLYASTKKGNRPSYIRAARPEHAIPLYDYFIEQLEVLSHSKIETGKFGADMKVSLTNDGPVTILIDSKSRE